MNRLKQQEVKHTKKYSQVTNPLRVGVTEYETLQKINNRRIIFDRVMFIVLGMIAICAFYNALTSLML